MKKRTALWLNCLILVSMIVFVFTPVLLQAQEVAFKVWEAHYDNSTTALSYEDIAQKSAVDAQSNVYVSGTTTELRAFGSTYGIHLKFFEVLGSGAAETTTKGVTYGPMGKKRITDHSYTAIREDVFQSLNYRINVSKSDPNGWSVYLNHPLFGGQYYDDQPVALAIDAAGDVFFTDIPNNRINTR